MRFDDFVERNNAFYKGTLDAYGPAPRGVDLNSTEAQELRFEQLLKLLDSAGPFSLNDFGCGYGALVAYMSGRALAFRYRGFDISEDAITHATRLYGARPDCTFVAHASELEEADYTVASGIFNRHFGAGEEEWLAFILATLDRMAVLSRRGFAFNLLTKYSDPDRMQSHLYYADPCVLFDYCKRTFSRRVALLHDYPLYDFTILVRT